MLGLANSFNLRTHYIYILLYWDTPFFWSSSSFSSFLAFLLSSFTSDSDLHMAFGPNDFLFAAHSISHSTLLSSAFSSTHGHDSVSLLALIPTMRSRTYIGKRADEAELLCAFVHMFGVISFLFAVFLLSSTHFSFFCIPSEKKCMYRCKRMYVPDPLFKSHRRDSL